MAVRLNRRHSEQTLSKINVSNVITRLQQCVDGEKELTPQQIAAARILLDKTLANAPTMTKELDAQELAEWKLKL